MRYMLAISLMLLLGSCTYRSQETLLTGNWRPVTIEKDGKPFIKVADTDYLSLKADYTFYYELVHASKYMHGTWKYEDRKLSLTYDSLNLTRTFSVSELSGYNLIFSENNTVFSYIRLKN